jgi:hypothetical protein
MNTRKTKKFNSQNRNAVIRTREDRTGKTRTETCHRDEGTVTVAISTNPKTDSTRMFVDFPNRGASVEFSGSEARTLYRLLQKHYLETGKTY